METSSQMKSHHSDIIHHVHGDDGIKVDGIKVDGSSSRHSLSSSNSNKPSEKSVETTNSTIAAEDCYDDFEQDGCNNVIRGGYEILIAASPSSSTLPPSSPALGQLIRRCYRAAAAASSPLDINDGNVDVMVASNKTDSSSENKMVADTADAANNSTAVLPSPPPPSPTHIYALRRIIVEYPNDDDINDGFYYYDAQDDDAEEEQDDDAEIFYDAQEDIITHLHSTAATIDAADTANDTATNTTAGLVGTNCPPQSQQQQATSLSQRRKTTRTRMITSQIVQLSENQYSRLESMSREGTVLFCWSDSNDDDGLVASECHDDVQQQKLPKTTKEKEEIEDRGGAAKNNDDNENDDDDDIDNGYFKGEKLPPAVYSSFLSTTNDDDNNGNNNNGNGNEVHKIAVVPYSMAQRQMRCNCTIIKNNKDVATNNSNNGREKEKKERSSSSSSLKAAFKLFRRTILKNMKKCRNNNNSSSCNSGSKQEEYCKECNLFGSNPTIPTKNEKRSKRERKHHKNTPFMNVGATIYGEEAVLDNAAEPIKEILSIDQTLGIYVCESGLTASKCLEIIDAAERLAHSKGKWSAYTYAKQTLGCKEYDDLALASKDPVMTACATVRDRLDVVWEANNIGSGVSDYVTKQGAANATTTVDNEKDQTSAEAAKAKNLVLDIREPHVVKYDISRMELQKLDMHTDRSVWTFVIALSEGRGQDYKGGGTFFEKLNATVHLQRGQMLIFRGKLRHRGVKITDGTRYLLVGFLVEQKANTNT